MTRIERVNMVIEFCKKQGITKADICRKFELKKAEDLHNGQIKDLSKMARQVSSGEKKVRDLFPKK